MTPSIDQTLHQFANSLPNWTLSPILTLFQNFGGFHRTLQRVRLANRGRLLLQTPGPVPFGTCICFNVETILSRTCHVYGPFEFGKSLGSFILLLTKLNPVLCIGWHGSVGRALGRCSIDCWAEPAVRHYFSSNYIRMLAYVFTVGNPYLEWLKRNESNRLYWFETRFLSLVYL